MKRRVVLLLLGVSVFVAASLSAVAQEMRPDDRYYGYPQSLIEWPKSPPDMDICQAAEYYEPADTHLTKYVNRVTVADTRVQRFDECVWMLTRYKWRWVLRPRGTEVLVDEQGRDLFDHGSPFGMRCDNPRPFSFVVEVERTEQSTPIQRMDPSTFRLPPDPVKGPWRSTAVVPTHKKKKGLCSGKTCRWTVAVLGVAAAGYAVWYFQPCPPGTTRRR